MSQPSSSSSTSFGPVQLSLFMGEFDITGQERVDRLASTVPLSDTSLSDDLKLTGVERSVVGAESFCPRVVEFMEVFEAVSGWEVHFKESTASANRRSQGVASDDQLLRPQGQFEIIDMSIDWPAQTPTMHRGKCDQLIQLYSDLYSQCNASQDSFEKVQGLLAALTNPADQGDQLVDSFAPMFTSLVESDESDFVVGQESGFDDESESAFVVKQEFNSGWLANENIWDAWSFAGATGIVGDVYLDWAQRGDELTVYAGRIESSFGVGDTESSLEVNAISRQFKVSEGNTLAAFFFWDRRGGRLRSVDPGSWQTLYAQSAIIISTDPNVQMPESVVNAQLDAEPFTAEELATAIEAKLGSDHRVLVIKCD